MGGGSWSTDVPAQTTSSSGFKHSAQAKQVIKKEVAPKELKTVQKKIECPFKAPVGIAIDGTQSMGDLSFLMLDKSMRFAGQIPYQKYMEDFGISMCVYGDAHLPAWAGGHPDKYPIQMTKFEKNPELVKGLFSELFIEEGGGGQAKESAELVMYGYANCVTYPADAKGFLFIVSDEGFYPTVEAEHLRKHFGMSDVGSVETSKVIDQLRKLFYVFPLHVKAINYPNKDDQIFAQWQEAFGKAAIRMTDPNAVVDIMLGCIARVTRTRTLDEYIKHDMEEQGQTVARQNLVEKTLGELEGIDWKV